MRKLWKTFVVLSIGAALIGCGTDSGSGDVNESSADDGTPSSSTPVTITQSGGTGIDSSVSLRLTDAPVDDLTRVMVTFTEIEFKRQSGGWLKYTLATPAQFDLLSLQGGVTADLLSNVDADADDFKELRLITSGDAGDNYVELLAGGTKPLQIPSGSSSGLKIKQNFSISPQGADLVIDFDLRQSIRSPGNSGKYQLKPVMRLVSASETGNIQGVVDSADLTAPSCSDALVDTYNAAYVFSGHDVVPDDINQQSGSGVEPVATTTVTYDADSDSYIYVAPFLPAGDYTVAVTCNADHEDLQANDNLQFFDIENTTVIANNTVFL